MERLVANRTESGQDQSPAGIGTLQGDEQRAVSGNAEDLAGGDRPAQRLQLFRLQHRAAFLQFQLDLVQEESPQLPVDGFQGDHDRFPGFREGRDPHPVIDGDTHAHAKESGQNPGKGDLDGLQGIVVSQAGPGRKVSGEHDRKPLPRGWSFG